VLPKILAYPKLLPFFTSNSVSPGDSVRNVLCYILEHYGDTGLTLLIYRDSKTQQIIVLCGDWNGNSLDLTVEDPLTDLAKELLSKHLDNILGMMKYIKLDQAQIYFAVRNGEFILVDIQTAINKFSGPGMVRDLFSNAFNVPKIIKIEPIDDRVLEAIKEGTGNYSSDLIIKPSRFRIYEDGIDNYKPLYLEVKR